jgi:nucleoside-diphosphate-sugar epimerase
MKVCVAGASGAVGRRLIPCALASIECGAPSVYNIVDEEPAPVAEWLPTLAVALGGPAAPARSCLRGWLVLGEHGVALTQIRGASNATAKRELVWQPGWPSWRDGFRRALAR